MTQQKIDNQQGHWILAKMGKRVVEFFSGIGMTAQMTLAINPKSSTGVDLSEEDVRCSCS